MRTLTDRDVDEILEQWDQTAPAIQRKIVAQVMAERHIWKLLAKALDKLLVCYRVGKQPGDTLLDEIAMLRKDLE